MKWVILGVDVEIVEVGGLLGTNAEHNGPSRETPVGLDGSNHSNRSNRSNGCHGCCHGCCGGFVGDDEPPVVFLLRPIDGHGQFLLVF